MASESGRGPDPGRPRAGDRQPRGGGGARRARRRPGPAPGAGARPRLRAVGPAADRVPRAARRGVAAGLPRQDQAALRAAVAGATWRRSSGRRCRTARALEAVWTSLSRGAVGFAMSLVIGSLLGLAMWWSRWLRAAIGPIVSGLQSLPSVAWVPAAIIWFQLTDAAIYTVVLLGCGAVDRQRPAQRPQAGAAAVRPRRPGARASRRSAGSGTCCCRLRCPATSAACGRAGRSPGAR